jgi:hypothetical protein
MQDCGLGGSGTTSQEVAHDIFSGRPGTWTTVHRYRREHAGPNGSYVRGYWVHRSVNVGDNPFVTLFCYAADAGQNYGLIADAGGMAQLVVADGNGGWTTRPNPDHIGYRMEAY